MVSNLLAFNLKKNLVGLKLKCFQKDPFIYEQLMYEQHRMTSSVLKQNQKI